jgi:hypothetical protein
MKNLIGTKFNYLTVICADEEKSTKKRKYFLCDCECGKRTSVRSDGLKSGKVKSCGCSRVKNLEGKKFGTLVVLSRAKSNCKRSIAYWKCICECSKEIVARGSHLMSGNVKSCGRCFLIKDITGKVYGKLKAICVSKYENRVRWLCQCECGNKITVQQTNLSSGHVRSCGCSSQDFGKQTCLDKYGVDHPSKDITIAMKMAKGQNNSYTLKHWKTGEKIVCVASYEKRVVEYLNKNKINFRWQSRIFKMPNGKTYRPDLYIFSTKKWIEIKGYFRKDAKKKWDWFHKEKPNSELWNKAKLKEMRII